MRSIRIHTLLAMVMLLAVISFSCVSERSIFFDDTELKFGKKQGNEAPRFLEEYSWILYRSQRYVESARFHVLAASMAYVKKVDNYKLIAARNISEALSILENISIGKLYIPREGKVKQDFRNNARFFVRFRGKNMSSVPIMVVQRYQLPNGQYIKHISNKISDQHGVISVLPITPVSTGTQVIQLSFSFETLMGERLSSIPVVKEVRYPVERFLHQKIVIASIAIDSDAKNNPIAVAVTDVDVAGSIIEESNSSKGIVTKLQQEGFSVIHVNIPTLLSKGEVIDLVRKKYGESVDRLLFGTTTIVKFEEMEKGYAIDVRSNVQVLDIKTETVLFTVNRRQRSSGKNSSSTVVNSLRVVGTRVGEEVSRGLP